MHRRTIPLLHDNEYVELSLQVDTIKHIKEDKYRCRPNTYYFDKVQKLKMSGNASKTEVPGKFGMISEVIMKEVKNNVW